MMDQVISDDIEEFSPWCPEGEHRCKMLAKPSGVEISILFLVAKESQGIHGIHSIQGLEGLEGGRKLGSGPTPTTVLIRCQNFAPLPLARPEHSPSRHARFKP